jgi:hypothetical protein
MSDTSGGPGWWQASDGKWYPPSAASEPPPSQPPPSQPPPSEPPTPPDGWAAPSAPPPPGGGGPVPPPSPPFGTAPYGVPPQPGAPYQPYGQPTATQGSATNGMAVASMVLGILGIVTFCAWGFGALLGLLAIVLGAVAIRNAKRQPGTPGVGMAWAGVITGIVAVIAGVVVFALLVLAIATSDGTSDFEGINTDPSDGVCDEDRFLQDPDC